ncbi:hypothetical protein KC333_g7112 [Hortaea werneckii]|nr:hypothetical protein KC333_g7112 [Hortaea werneckii]KAI7323554.1 hypothetical protein KC326_g1491 [Hortaea werneckii]
MDNTGYIDHNEHQKVMDGFGAQIDRLDRRLHKLCDQLIAAGDAITVDRLSDETAAAKKQKAEIEKLQEDELANYNRALIRAHTEKVPPTVHRRPSLNGKICPGSQEVIDLTHDETTPAIKRERSASPVEPRPHSKTPGTWRGPPRILEQDAQQTFQNHQNSTARHAKTTATNFHNNSRNFCDFPMIAESHPTLIPSPDGPGAVELRCGVCGCNASSQNHSIAGRPRLWNGIRGVTAHLRLVHGTHPLGNKTMPVTAIVRACTHTHVPQEVVDAIKSGDTEAYLVPGITVPRPTPRSKKANGSAHVTQNENERDVAGANGQAANSHMNEQQRIYDGYLPFQPVPPWNNMAKMKAADGQTGLQNDGDMSKA